MIARRGPHSAPAQVADGWSGERDAKKLGRLVEYKPSDRSILCLHSDVIYLPGVNTISQRLIPSLGLCASMAHELGRGLQKGWGIGECRGKRSLIRGIAPPLY